MSTNTETVYGAFRLAGKPAYDKAIDGAPVFIDPPELQVVRMVEQGDGLIAERRAWVIPLNENDYR